MGKTRLPLTALDMQLDLLRHYTKNPHGRLYADAVVDAALYSNSTVPIAERQEIGLHVHRSILGAGDTFAVSSDIVSVIDQAAQSLPSFILHPEDLPSLNGFVWLEHPIIVKDINEKNLVVKAFGWNTAHFKFGDDEDEMAVIMLAWTDPRDSRDHAYVDWERPTGDEFAPPSGLLSMIAGIFPFNEEWLSGRFGNPIHPEKPVDPGLGRFWLTFLRFLAEPWINTERYEPDRHQAKRAIRTLEHVPAIHVVHLRRRAQTGNADHEAGNVEWSHRWLVRGHWRNQWYPSLEVHKPRWIAEHIKGPEAMPLVVHDKIFAVER
jgi:hypothetical protein